MTPFEKENLIIMMTNIDDIWENLSSEEQKKFRNAFNKIDNSYHKILMVNK